MAQAHPRLPSPRFVEQPRNSFWHGVWKVVDRSAIERLIAERSATIFGLGCVSLDRPGERARSIVSITRIRHQAVAELVRVRSSVLQRPNSHEFSYHLMLNSRDLNSVEDAVQKPTLSRVATE
jgi:hypothetical protein